MPAMKFDPNSPIWLQVATDLETNIAAGRILPGDKLPGGRELALSYSINPNTAARIYQELEREGVCMTRRGTGTFVTEREDRIQTMKDHMARQAADRFLAELAGLGFSREEAVQWLLKEEDVNDHE